MPKHSPNVVKPYISKWTTLRKWQTNPALVLDTPPRKWQGSRQIVSTDIKQPWDGRPNASRERSLKCTWGGTTSDPVLVTEWVSAHLRGLDSEHKTMWVQKDSLNYTETPTIHVRWFKNSSSSSRNYSWKQSKPTSAALLSRITQVTCSRVWWSISGLKLYTGMFFQFLEDL